MTGVRSHRASLWLLLIAALFMRALVPQGYMPGRSDSGAITVTLCGSGGVWQIPFKDGAKPEKKEQRAESPCAFAGLAAPAVPPPATFALPLPVAIEAIYPARPTEAALVASPRLLPPARGPPLPA